MFLSKIIDDIVERKFFSLVLFHASIFLILSFLREIVRYFSSNLCTYITENLVISLMIERISKFENIEREYFVNNKPNSVADLVYTDSDRVVNFTIVTIFDFLSSIFQIIILLIIVINNFPVVLIFFVIITVLYIIIHNLLKNKIKLSVISTREKQSEFIRVIHHTLLFNQYLKINNIFDYSYKWLKEVNKNYVLAKLKSVNISNLSSLFVIFVEIFITFAMLSVSAVLVFAGKITIGQITLMRTYVHNFFESMKVFMTIGRLLHTTYPSALRLLKIDKDIKISYQTKLGINEISEINISNIKHKCINNANYREGISFNFPKNEISLIKGASGKGKSTLIDIISGILSTESGDVFYNDKNIKDLNTGKILENNISILAQKTEMYFDNIECFEDFIKFSKQNHEVYMEYVV